MWTVARGVIEEMRRESQYIEYFADEPQRLLRSVTELTSRAQSEGARHTIKQKREVGRLLVGDGESILQCPSWSSRRRSFLLVLRGTTRALPSTYHIFPSAQRHAGGSRQLTGECSWPAPFGGWPFALSCCASRVDRLHPLMISMGTRQGSISR